MPADLLAPRWEGGIFCPSQIFAITWKLRKISPPNFQYLIGHQFDTLSENFVKFGLKRFHTMTFQWRHDMRFWAKNGRQLYRLLINAYWRKSQTKGVKTKEIDFSIRRLSRIFKKLYFDPKISKSSNFVWEKCSKIQKFRNLQKNVYMYRTYIRLVSMPNFKFVSQFLTPKWP